MPVIRGNFFDEIKSYVVNNKFLCMITSGIAGFGYSIGNLAGRVISWIAKCVGTDKKTSSEAIKIFQGGKDQDRQVKKISAIEKIEDPRSKTSVVSDPKDSENVFSEITTKAIEPTTDNITPPTSIVQDTAKQSNLENVFDSNNVIRLMQGFFNFKDLMSIKQVAENINKNISKNINKKRLILDACLEKKVNITYLKQFFSLTGTKTDNMPFLTKLQFGMQEFSDILENVFVKKEVSGTSRLFSKNQKINSLVCEIGLTIVLGGEDLEGFKKVVPKVCVFIPFTFCYPSSSGAVEVSHQFAVLTSKENKYPDSSWALYSSLKNDPDYFFGSHIHRELGLSQIPHGFLAPFTETTLLAEKDGLAGEWDAVREKIQTLYQDKPIPAPIKGDKRWALVLGRQSKEQMLQRFPAGLIEPSAKSPE